MAGRGLGAMIGALGQPWKIEGSGSETICFFKDRKVTFRDEKVVGVNLLEESPALPAGGEARPQIASGDVPEPEIAGAIYVQDDKGKLILLEKIEWRIKGLAAHIEVEGEKSTIRLKAAQKIVFTVRLEKGMDLHVSLFPLEATQKGRRRTIPRKDNKYLT